MDTECRYCDQPLGAEAVKTHSYWGAFPFSSHPACKVEGYKKEAYECQVIDADCNDCLHFKRGQMVQKGIWQGECLKYQKPMNAYPNYASGHACFQHRKSLNEIT